MTEVKLEITGMTCSACSSTVEKSLKKVEGVISAEVNLLTNSAKVSFDEQKCDIDNLINAVSKAGYGVAQKKHRESSELKKYDESAKKTKERLLVSICFLILLMYVSMGHMIGLPLPPFIAGEENIITFAFVQFLLVLPIVFYNREYYISGFKKLFHLSPNMDTLVAIGSTAALVYGIFAICRIGNALAVQDLATVQAYHMDLYFESAGTILTLVTVGKYLESRSKKKTSETLDKLMNLSPKTALKIQNNLEIETPVENIMIGDILLCKPGMVIACDGVVVEGESTIDESMISGESMPVYKTKGNNVFSGSINTVGTIKYEVTKRNEDSTVATIVKLVEEASASKAPISRFADKISGIFVPCVIGISLIATIIWLICGATIEFSLSIGISVLVISCPCALGLATPLAIMVGTGVGATNHILIKSATALENLHNVSYVVFDKTGTITEGKPKVQTVLFKEDNKQEILSIIMGLEQLSSHPLANAVVSYCKENNIETATISDFETIVGKGIKGVYQGEEYYCASYSYAIEKGLSFDEKDLAAIQKEGMTLLVFFSETKIYALLGVSDTIKPSSAEAIRKLKDLRIKTLMLTGDNAASANYIAKQLELDEVKYEVLPEEKEKVIADLQKKGFKVAMVGDGINDSIALTKADIGIAIGAGSDIAIDSADVILMRSDLMDVIDAIRLSKKTINNIKMNLFWAFFYNAIGIPLAAGVLYQPLGLKLNPMIAAAAMSLSSVCVCLNALRIKSFKPSIRKEEEFMEKNFIVEGMMCEHCVKHVKDALLSLPNVTEVEVNLKTKEVKLKSKDPLDNEVIKQKIQEAGYEAIF